MLFRSANRQAKNALAAVPMLPPDSGLMDPTIRATLQGYRDRLVAAGINPDQREPFDAFFTDDKPHEPITTASTWPLKLHEQLVDTVVITRAHDINDLLTFRQTVANFPAKPQHARGDDLMSEAEEAFDEAWRLSRPSGADIRVASGAWRAYRDIQSGVLRDSDTQRTRLALSRTSGALPPSTPTVPQAGTP